MSNENREHLVFEAGEVYRSTGYLNLASHQVELSERRSTNTIRCWAKPQCQHAVHQHGCQTDLRLNRARIESQRVLEKADLLCEAVARPRSQSGDATPQNEIERIMIIGWPSGLCGTSSTPSAFAIRFVISFCASNRSPKALSMRSAHK